VVDYAFALEAIDQPFKFRIDRGNLGHSTVNIFNMSGDTPELITSFKHAAIVGGPNPAYFSVDLTPLRDSPPMVTTIQGKSHEKMLWAFYYPWYSRTIGQFLAERSSARTICLSNKETLPSRWNSSKRRD
jgi:hypothetical protein